MTLPFMRADAIREYLTGAASDGEAQDNPSLSFGNFRSSISAHVHNIQIDNALDGVVVEASSGFNPEGIGLLESGDGVSLTWQAPGALIPGPAVFFDLDQELTRIVESVDPSQFLRIRARPPFTNAIARIAISTMVENVFGFNNVSNAVAVAGAIHYRATILRNESNSDVTNLCRYTGQLGTQALSDQVQLSGAGSGTIRSSGSLGDWPLSGWCQVRQSGGTLREVVYYNSRTQNALTVPAAGRGLLGTSAGAGASTDTIHAVPGVAIGFDPAGVQAFGAGITNTANESAAPGGVTWNLGLTVATGLIATRIQPTKQIGIWIKRQLPAGVLFSSNVHNRFSSTYTV